MQHGSGGDIDLARSVHALGERVKELTALHETARLIQDDRLATEELLGHVVQLMPPAFQFPEITAARARYGALSRATAGFSESVPTLTARFATRDGTAGWLDVVYLEARPAAAEGPFLTEERNLIDSVVEMLQSALDRRLAQASLVQSEEDLAEALSVAAAERDRARLLLDVTNAVVSERNLPELLDAISRILHQTIPHHFASVTLWDERAGAPPGAGPGAARAIPLQTGRGRYGTLNVAAPLDQDFPAAERLLLEQIAKQLSIAIENAVHFEEISALKERLREEKLYLEDEITQQHGFNEIVGNSRVLTSVLRQIRTVAPTDATVLLLGETGTGKELLARSIHDASRRHTQTFVRINGAALPSGLVESELFGYEKGAFTGAISSKVGRLELAHRGTLFLDEVGDIPLEVQPKLLRALQEQEFERLGSTRTQRVDVRLIAATNRDLGEMVARNAFRSDFYYRLSVFPIVIPPLRDRPDDIPFLVQHFVRKFAAEMGRSITTIPAGVMRELQQWTWPGNIRELQNVIERAVILSPGPSLQVPAGAFRDPMQSRARVTSVPARGGDTAVDVTVDATFDDGQRELIVKALRDAGGVIAGPNGAAARLGLKRTTLHAKMRRLGIARPSF